MLSSSALAAPSGACPASALVMAVRLAKTPLAVADARSTGRPILFANDAFIEFVGRDADALVGLPLAALIGDGGVELAQGATRFTLTVGERPGLAVALSTAAVADADGAPFCLLCSLVDARGDGADEAIARDAGLLAEVAQAASGLLHESALAAQARAAPDNAAADIARDAYERAAGEARPHP